MGQNEMASPLESKMINKDQIEQIKEEAGDNFVASNCRGNTLWLVKRVEDIPTLFQIRFFKEGMKVVSERDGPDQLFCSREMLSLAPPANPEWRKKVLDYWEQKDEAMRKWQEIKKRFRELGDNETILIHFKPGWNLEFGYLEDPKAGKVRSCGKLWKIKQRDSIESWEVISD